MRLPIEDSPYRLDQHGPIFVIGCPRSGTTFLAEAIGAIRGIEYLPAVLVPPRLVHLIGKGGFSAEEEYQLLRVVRDSLWQALWRRHYSRSERFLEWVRGNAAIPWNVAARSMEGIQLCYKEPFLGFALPQFANHFPNARFIHILRDGRDNADSLQRRYPDALADRVLKSPTLAENKNSEIGPWRRHGNFCIPWWIDAGDEKAFLAASHFGRCVWMWQEIVSRITGYASSLGPKRYLEVRYESLARDPVTNGRAISDFVGVDRDRRFQARLANATARSVDISKRRQPPTRLEEAKQIAGALLAKLGYGSDSHT